MRPSLHYLLFGLAAAGFTLAGSVNLSPAADTAAVPATSPATAPAPGDAAKNGETGQDAPPAVPLLSGVHPVKLVKTDGKWQLLRDDKPYFIKGVGGDGKRDTLVANGGNSVRIWGIDHKTTPVELNEDDKRGLTVALGYWVGHKDNGFKADDPAAVKAQLEEFKRVVKIYKDHPAVLVWAIGNEMENANDTPALWQSIEDLAKAAHELDPNHPTMTVIAEVGGNKVANLHKYCPSLDIVGINSYAGGQNVGDRYLKQAPAGAAKPYIITEFGPPGQWEYWSKTKFGALNEMTSTEKSTWYKNSYEKTVLGHPNECLGSYAFIWGYKLEATSTWYGMFLPDGSKTAAVDVMQEEWSGKKTETPCPVMKKLAVIGSNDVKAGDVVKASMDATDPGNGKLRYEWALVREMGTYDVQEPGAVGPPSYPDAIAKNGEAEASFTMPKVNGVYRIYGYARNENGGAALCSVPVKVTGGEAAPFKAPKANLPYVVVGENKSAKNYIPSGYMGDNKFVKMVDSTDNPHAGKSSLKCTFTVTTGADGKSWQCPDTAFDATKLTGKGGVVWQSPVNDWGSEPGGYDFTGAKQVTFWARGAEGGEKAKFGIGFLTKEREAGKQYYDSEKVEIAVTLTSEWKQYTIDLTGKNVTVIKSGFFWEAQATGAPATFYLSEIKYE